MEKFNFSTPKFLFCEIPIKDNSINDNRIWVYHIKSLSLIEIINVDQFKDFEFKGVKERFEYENSTGFLENYFAVFTQNNCSNTNQNEKEVLKKAWQFYKNYLIWEDKNIDNL
jgi:hypothetical protein